MYTNEEKRKQRNECWCRRVALTEWERASCHQAHLCDVQWYIPRGIAIKKGLIFFLFEIGNGSQGYESGGKATASVRWREHKFGKP